MTPLTRVTLTARRKRGTGRGPAGRVAGEAVADLLPALQVPHEGLVPQRDGHRSLSGALPAACGTPFLRALVRVEAQLLRQDAEGLARGAPWREPDERRADALVELLRRVGAAVR